MDNIVSNSNKHTLQYICEIVQRGRIKPAKFKHWLKMQRYIYEELREKGIIAPEIYFIEESAFFQYSQEEVIINFINHKMINDLQIRIQDYFIVKFLGTNPILRGGTMF